VDWLTTYKIPVGQTAKAAVDWLTQNLGWFFDGLALVMQALVDAMLWLLETPHPVFVIAVPAPLHHDCRVHHPRFRLHPQSGLLG
jgi:glycine betaine/proline transport system permease protein